MTPNVLVRLCHICMITQANLNSTGYILVFLNKKKKLKQKKEAFQSGYVSGSVLLNIEYFLYIFFFLFG